MNIRTVVFSVMLVAIFVLTIGLVATGAEIMSDASSNPVRLHNPQQQSDTWNAASIPPYRARLLLDECFDVPIGEAAKCWNRNQAPIP